MSRPSRLPPTRAREPRAHHAARRRGARRAATFHRRPSGAAAERSPPHPRPATRRRLAAPGRLTARAGPGPGRSARGGSRSAGRARGPGQLRGPDPRPARRPRRPGRGEPHRHGGTTQPGGLLPADRPGARAGRDPPGRRGPGDSRRPRRAAARRPALILLLAQRRAPGGRASRPRGGCRARGPGRGRPAGRRRQGPPRPHPDGQQRGGRGPALARRPARRVRPGREPRDRLGDAARRARAAQGRGRIPGEVGAQSERARASAPRGRPARDEGARRPAGDHAQQQHELLHHPRRAGRLRVRPGAPAGGRARPASRDRGASEPRHPGAVAARRQGRPRRRGADGEPRARTARRRRLLAHDERGAPDRGGRGRSRRAVDVPCRAPSAS